MVLSQKLAEMHRRLAETAMEEQALVRALNSALNHVDEKLLSEIRLVTSQHEARRATIMNELQLLATRLCAFPIAPPEPVAAIDDQSSLNGHLARPGQTHAPGNWRIAAQNVQDDLDFYSDGPVSSH
jgi:hypothetical protein